MIHSPLGSRYAIGGALGRSVKRDAAGFLPTDISGLIHWYDFSDASTMFTDDGTTQVANDADAIYRINNKVSGKTDHLKQTTLSRRPLYKTNILNGLSAGLGNRAATKQLNATSSTTLTQYRTRFIVALCSDNLSSGQVSGMFGQDRIGFEGAVRRYMMYQGKLLYSSNYKWVLGQFVIVTSIMNLTASQIYANGILVGEGDIGNGYNQGVSLFSTSNDNYLTGYTCEALQYEGVLSEANRLLVDSYLNTKWAVYS